MSNIEQFRNSFDRSGPWIHLNNAGVSPMCIPAAKALETAMSRLVKEGYHAVAQLWDDTDLVRAKLAKFLGAQADEVAFFQATSAAITQVSLGLDLKPGDEIITWDQEYPSNFYPWRAAVERTGAKLVIAKSGENLETPLEAIIKEVTPRTKVIATSWVQFRTGATLDLKALAEFARPRGIFTCVDIIQGAGYLPFNFKDLDIDAACGGSQKWMVSCPIVGFLVLKQEHIEKIKPLMYGAITYGDQNGQPSLSTPFKPGALRYEPGSRTLLDIAAFGAAIDLLAKTGIAEISQEVEWLGRKLRHGLEERGYTINSPHGRHHRGGIVNFSVGPNAKFKTQAQIAAALAENKISFGERPPGVRLSPHAFNTEADIAKVLALL